MDLTYIKFRTGSGKSAYKLDIKNDLDLRGVNCTMARPRPPYSGRRAMKQVEVVECKPILNDLAAIGTKRWYVKLSCCTLYCLPDTQWLMSGYIGTFV